MDATTTPLDEGAVQRCAEGRVLNLPRGPQRGRSGERRAPSVGSSLEIQDWRAYQPGDDVRAMDWNASARTGELILRLREDEVSPRAEVVLDASRSMAIDPEKAARAREVALLLCELARRQGLQTTLLLLSARPERVEGSACAATLRAVALDGVEPLPVALRRSPPLRRCGLRMVVSDFLFEAPLLEVVARLSREASALALIQLVTRDDLEPDGGAGATLVDAESGEKLEHLLDEALLASYQRRFAQHQEQLRAAAQRARAWLTLAPAEAPLETLVRERLFPLVSPVGAEAAWP